MLLRRTRRSISRTRCLCLLRERRAGVLLGARLAVPEARPRPIREFRVRTNGASTGRGLVDALRYFGLPAIDATEKDAFRGLAIRGRPYTGEEERALMAYCEGDVIALERLFEAMRDQIDWPHALHRGNYMKTVAKMEHRGVPVDSELVSQFADHRTIFVAR